MSVDTAHDSSRAASGGHHEAPEERYKKERLALWLFIGGDFVFFVLEVFTWFYLKALDTNGMWRGASCTTASPCPTGLATNGNYGSTGVGVGQITHLVPQAPSSYTLIAAALTIVTALGFLFVERGAASGAPKASLSGLTLLPLVSTAAAAVVVCLQYSKLPFQTVEGTYASTFEFFMGSTLAHLLIVLVLAIGIAIRTSAGRYSGGRPWYQLRLVRTFTAWCAFSTVILALIMSFTA